MSDPVLKACDEFITSEGIDTGVRGWKSRLTKPPALPFDGARSYYWDIETSHGPLTVKLMPDVAPMHASSTVYLARLGFYDNLAFHRVIPGFMAQGGCPLGTGTGGPGYQYGGEFDRKVRHDRPGLLSMANAGEGTDGSQFFLTFVPTAWLDDKHTIFGEVVEGAETLKELEQRGSQSGRTTEEVSIVKTSIRVE